MITYTRKHKDRWEYGILPTPAWYVPLGYARTQIEATALVLLASQQPIDIQR